MWPFTSDTTQVDHARELKNASRQAAIDWATTTVPAVPLRDDLPVLSASLLELRTGFQTKKWTVVRVLEAFIRSAIRSHERCNNLTELLFESALDRARHLDALLEQQGPEAALADRPLFGIPISIKDQIDIQGCDSSMGYSARVQQPAEEHAAVTQLLWDAGAVLFVKTNVPQTMLSFECGNPVFGRTLNPYSKLHTSGGSSGGEASLLATDGAAVGIGSDIGGSCRIPASFSGCFGLKPCYPRIPRTGLGAANKGFEGIKATTGPMARSIDDLTLLFRVIVDELVEQKYHRVHETVPLPFRDVELPKRLKIGYWKSDRFVKASPASQRAVQESVDALTNAGHELVELEPPNIVEALRIFVALAGGDGYERLLGSLHGDPPEPHLFLIRFQAALGPRLTHLSAWLSSGKDPIMSDIVMASGVKPVSELLAWQEKRNAFADATRRHFFGDLGLDAIVSPVQASPAIKLGTSWNLAFLAAPTVFFNVVDSAVTAVPVTKVDPKLDVLTDEWHKQPKGSFVLEHALYSDTHGQYDATGDTQGLPVGVQVACSLYEEEKSLKIAKVLDEALGSRDFGTGHFAAGLASNEAS